jgi:hypothetical protein
MNSLSSFSVNIVDKGWLIKLSSLKWSIADTYLNFISYLAEMKHLSSIAHVAVLISFISSVISSEFMKADNEWWNLIFYLTWDYTSERWLSFRVSKSCNDLSELMAVLSRLLTADS